MLIYYRRYIMKSLFKKIYDKWMAIDESEVNHEYEVAQMYNCFRV